ncbi:MAG: type I restriction endonuclease subunit M, partial [Spirochaetota bacterium]|nr:type I restriction endonuclease subunit M [Spirochaetota bacterium]
PPPPPPLSVHTGKKKTAAWEGRLIPKALVIEKFFADDQKAIDAAEAGIAAMRAELDEIIENAEDGSVINDVRNDKDELSKDALKKELAARVGHDDEDAAALRVLAGKIELIDKKNKILKDLKTKLDKKTREQYGKLTNAESLDLLLERKWYAALQGGVCALYEAVSHRITGRVMELAERYDQTLPMLEAQAAELEGKVKSHLEEMGFVW